MIDRDLAVLFDVETKHLNEKVARNPDRFPESFCFQLSRVEYLEIKEVVAKCDRLESTKYTASLPHTFTEQGIAALASVLRSPVADRMSVMIANEFVRLKHAEKSGAAKAPNTLDVL